MSVWTLVFGIQSAVFFAGLFIGVFFLRMRLGSAILAMAIMMPVPLLQVAGGTGSWVFAGDIVAALFALRMVLGLGSRSSNPAQQHRGLILMAFVILIALPLFSTLTGIVANPQPRTWKFIILQLVRAMGYFVVFRSFISRAGKEDKPDSMLLLQCLAFALISLAGLAQYAFHLNLDLWNVTRNDSFGRGTIKFGGGYMGLYRGAVGAWGVGILGIIPLVMASRRGWNILMPFIMVVVLAGILSVGSRQGVAIGAVAFVLGLIYAVRAMPPEYRLRALMRTAVALVLLSIVAGYGWQRISQDKLGRYVTKRFDELVDFQALMQSARNREPRRFEAWDSVTGRLTTFVFGLGYGVESTSSTNGGRSLLYVDSELFYMWQLGGTFLMIAYIAFLVRFRLTLRQSNRPAEPNGRTVAMAGIVVLYSGILLMWGHFFILTTFSHEAPIAYWTWAVFGMAVGECSRSSHQAWAGDIQQATNRAGQFENEYDRRDYSSW